MAVAAGTRMRCAACGSEAIVVKPQDPQIECCGRPLEVTFVPPGAG